MNKKIKVFIASAIAIFFGLGIYTFAAPNDETNELQEGNTKQVKENTSKENAKNNVQNNVEEPEEQDDEEEENNQVLQIPNQNQNNNVVEQNETPVVPNTQNEEPQVVDTTAPVVNVSYSTSGVSKEVTVEITSNEELQELEGWTLSQDKLKLTKVFTTNTDQEIVVKDLAGNEVNANVEIANVDTTAPVIKIKSGAVGTEEGYSKIDFKITDNVNLAKAILNNEKTITKTGTSRSLNYEDYGNLYQQGENTWVLYDEAGNTAEITFNIDTVDPEINNVTIMVDGDEEYLPTYYAKTGDTIIVSFETNEELDDPVFELKSGEEYFTMPNTTKVGSKASGYIYTGQYTVNEDELTDGIITFRISNIADNAGNTVEDITETTEETTLYVDRKLPQVISQVQKLNKAKGRIELTTEFSEPVITMGGNNSNVTTTKVTTYYYRTKTVTVGFKDLAGNENTYTTNIDMTAPTVNVTYSTTELTNQDVIVRLIANEEIQPVEGYSLSTGNTILSKTISSNTGDVEVVVKDLVGNETVVTYNVSNIDKIKPEVVSQVQKYNSKKDRIELTTEFSEPVITMGGNNKEVTTAKVTTYYYRTKTVTVGFKDLAGNENTYTVNIDKTAAKINVSYNTVDPTNKNVIVTLNSNESLKDIEGWNKIDDKTFTKTFEQNITDNITVYDLVGNPTKVNYSIINIDKVAPKVKVTYSTTNLTNGTVILRFTANEKIQKVDGYSISTGDTILSKTIYNNTSGTLTVTDLAGNTVDVDYAINNIIQEEEDLNSYLENNDKFNVKLEDNFTIENGLEIPNGKEVTLDLNGKELDLNFLYNNGKIIIKNGTINSDSELYNEGEMIIDNINLTVDGQAINSYSGNLEVTNSTISGTDWAIMMYEKGKVVNCNLSSTDNGYTIYASGEISEISGTTINQLNDGVGIYLEDGQIDLIKDVTITTPNGIGIDNDGTIKNIQNVNIKSYWSALDVQGTVDEVNNCKFESTNEYGIYVYSGTVKNINKGSYTGKLGAVFTRDESIITKITEGKFYKGTNGTFVHYTSSTKKYNEFVPTIPSEKKLDNKTTYTEVVDK